MIRLAVRVPGDEAGVVLAELIELAPDGVEQVDLDDGRVEYAVYGPPGEIPALPELRALAGGAAVEISTTEVADDWQERWKQFHKPVLVAAPASAANGPRRAVPSIRVRPPWEPSEDPSAPGAEIVELVIDPGQAFGTGAHATTRLCLGLLLELVAEEGCERAALDLGSGSGVLAIAAARLGFGPVLGLDNEPESVLAAAENAQVNSAAVAAERFDLRREPLPWLGPGSLDPPASPPAGTSWPPPPPGETVVLANLLRPLLIELSGALRQAPAAIIAGGMLAGELDEIAGVFAEQHAMSERRRRTEGDWGALWLAATGAR